ncbi:MAG: DoxX family protein [Bacteroidota bacterium]
MKLASLAGRLLFSLVFLTSGLSHFSVATIGYAASQGVPFASIAVPLSGSIALAGALSIILGYKARIGAVLIIVFLIPISLMMHAFWNVVDPMMHQMQMIMFMKNVSMLGGALFIVVHGSGPWSLDSKKGAAAHTHNDTISHAHTTHVL